MPKLIIANSQTNDIKMIIPVRQTEVLYRDKNSHSVNHARKKRHTHVWESDFRILGNEYQSNFKRKISESLFKTYLKL